MAPPQISSYCRNNPQHICSNAMLRHKCTDKSIWPPVGKAGPNSSCQCAAGLLMCGLDPLCAHYVAGIDRCSKSFKSDLKMGGLNTSMGSQDGICRQIRVTFTHVPCPGLFSWAPPPELFLVGIKCPTYKSGLGSGKLKFPSWSTVRTWAFTMGGGIFDE